ncbi:hypothetical protein [Rossellomorea vietnamensis]|nr:hypothetical protein [Rossellomorea vietnamensis]MCC5803799.1 hypothetical protein [Rossellomorea vietnamensis]
MENTTTAKRSKIMKKFNLNVEDKVSKTLWNKALGLKEMLNTYWES